MSITADHLARIIDHTVLRPDAIEADIARICDEARAFGFAAVCIAPWWIRFAAARLCGSNVRLATVIGFPHGNTLTPVKAFESARALEAGAVELDMVINVGALKNADDALVGDDIAAVVAEARQWPETSVKVILETALLTTGEKKRGCQLAEVAGADFVKTSTGFAASGATVADVALLRRVVGDRLGVKAAGGIRTLDDALAMIAAGADRLGCSTSVGIIQDLARRGQAVPRKRARAAG